MFQMKRLASFLVVLVMALPLAACGEGGLDFGPEEEPGVKYGSMGDTLSTAWFDFTVDGAYSCSEYCGYASSAGYKLVVVAMTLKNDRGEPVDLWGDDFVIFWGDDDSDLDIPLSAGLSGDQFPDEYVLSANELRAGVMVFEVPEEFRDFGIMFTDFFESETDPDGDAGSTYRVDFTAGDR